jgi:hypothetical protein
MDVERLGRSPAVAVTLAERLDDELEAARAATLLTTAACNRRLQDAIACPVALAT